MENCPYPTCSGLRLGKYSLCRKECISQSRAKGAGAGRSGVAAFDEQKQECRQGQGCLSMEYPVPSWRMEKRRSSGTSLLHVPSTGSSQPELGGTRHPEAMVCTAAMLWLKKSKARVSPAWRSLLKLLSSFLASPISPSRYLFSSFSDKRIQGSLSRTLLKKVSSKMT